MIVDVGGGTTEVAVISLGGIVASQSLRIAGDELDEAIVSYLRETRGVLIGEATAEELKIRIGSAHPERERGKYTVSGMHLFRRMGVMIEVSTGEVREAMEEPLNQIILAIARTLERTPPEISSDLYDFGLVLTGGGAMLPGLAALIYEKTGMKVRIAKRPMESVCAGMLRVIDGGGESEGLLRFRER
jgi:rod shape-determining protein MreB